MDALEVDEDGHGRFRDACVAYGDFYRPIFLKEFLNWFVRNANKAELATLRNAVSSRSANAGKGGKKGRPRAQDDPHWLVNVRIEAWWRIVEGRTWWKIAESSGLKPTRVNIRAFERTLTRRQDLYASIIWRACVDAGFWKTGHGSQARLDCLERGLATKKLQEWLWVRSGLPFGRFPGKDLTEGSKKIVLALVPRGEKAAARELIRRITYRRRRKTR
jgi:hypothetical protein